LTAADLSQSRLYGILDLGYVGIKDVHRAAEELLAGGIDLLQLRAKKMPTAEVRKLAVELHSLTAERHVPLVINDHPEIAREIGAEGVHLGQDDLPIAEARKIIGSQCAVGKSTHSVDQAIRAFSEGADYIGFGPIFATPTKPDYAPIGLERMAQVHESVRIPIFCIGGIKLDNLSKVIQAGARRVVIVSGLLQAVDRAEYARSVKDMLSQQPLACDF
jgi:thiamine-phosphate pyrophosphorylase